MRGYENYQERCFKKREVNQCCREATGDSIKNHLSGITGQGQDSESEEGRQALGYAHWGSFDLCLHTKSDAHAFWKSPVLPLFCQNKALAFCVSRLSWALNVLCACALCVPKGSLLSSLQSVSLASVFKTGMELLRKLSEL